MVEAISVANAVEAPLQDSQSDEDERSPFYIRDKIEIGVIAEKVAPNKKWIKTVVIVILSVYMYGAICLKYVGGAESFVDGINHTFWTDDSGFRSWLGFDPYYFGLAVFGFFSIYFSFGNIENAKTLQVISVIMRFAVTALMCSGSIYYIEENGVHAAPVFNWKHQIKYLA